MSSVLFRSLCVVSLVPALPPPEAWIAYSGSSLSWMRSNISLLHLPYLMERNYWFFWHHFIKKQMCNWIRDTFWPWNAKRSQIILHEDGKASIKLSCPLMIYLLIGWIISLKRFLVFSTPVISMFFSTENAIFLHSFLFNRLLSHYLIH